MQLIVNPNSYDKIKDFQKLLYRSNIDNEIKHESRGLVINFDENDYETIVSLAKRSRIYLDHI